MKVLLTGALGNVGAYTADALVEEGHDVVAFDVETPRTRKAAAQLDERRRAGFPPYVSEAVLRAEAPQLETAMAFLRYALEQAGAPAEISVYDPVPQLLTRRAGLERAKLLVQSDSRTRLQSFLAAWGAHLLAAPASLARRVRWHLDVDPIEFD